MPGVARSKPVNSNRLNASVTTAMPVANQRAPEARSLPKARVANPPRMGSQISRLSKGRLLIEGAGQSGAGADQHGQEHDQAEDHHERVMKEVSGLQPARESGDETDDSGAAIDRDAIDDMAVEGARTPSEHQPAAGQAAAPH